nr:uncharacterized protein LOC112936587 [Oryza sativa Japonica Group]
MGESGGGRACSPWSSVVASLAASLRRLLVAVVLFTWLPLMCHVQDCRYTDATALRQSGIEVGIIGGGERYEEDLRAGHEHARAAVVLGDVLGETERAAAGGAAVHVEGSSGKPAWCGVVARKRQFSGGEYGHHGPHLSMPKIGPPTSSLSSLSSNDRRRGWLTLDQQRRAPDGVHLAVGGDGEPRVHVVEERAPQPSRRWRGDEVVTRHADGRRTTVHAGAKEETWWGNKGQMSATKIFSTPI